MKKVDEIAQSLGFMVKRTCECNAFYYLVDENGFDKRNGYGEKLCVEIGESYGSSNKNSLPYLWHKNGNTKEIMTDWWSVSTYVTDSHNTCYAAYNPTIKKSEDKKRFVIDFDWHLAATEENFEKILKEILKRFYA